MKNRTPEEIRQELSMLEKRARKRALVFTIVPVLLALILLSYITRHIVEANEKFIRLNVASENIQKRIDSNDKVRKKQDSLINIRDIELKSSTQSVKNMLQVVTQNHIISNSTDK